MTADDCGAGCGPALPVEGGGKLPADTPPSVTVQPFAVPVVAGQPVSVAVVANEGERWFRDPNGGPGSGPIVTYAATTLVLDDATTLASGPGAGNFSVVFPHPGDHVLTASGGTTAGDDVVSRPVQAGNGALPGHRAGPRTLLSGGGRHRDESSGAPP